MSQAGVAGDDFVPDEIVLDAQPRAGRRSPPVALALALPGTSQDLSSSVYIDDNEVEFEAHGVKINQQGLFINGANVSEINPDDLQILGELGRGACSVVKKAQVSGLRRVPSGFFQASQIRIASFATTSLRRNFPVVFCQELIF